MALPHDNNPRKAQRTKVVHTYRDVSGHNATVSGSTQTITIWTGADISDNIGCVRCNNVGNGVLYVEPQGTAGTDSYPVPPGACYDIQGTAAEIRLAQLYASPDTLVGFMYKEVYQ